MKIFDGLYIVAGLIERDQHQLFNVAVLIDADGNIAEYRKVSDSAATSTRATRAWRMRYGVSIGSGAGEREE